MIQKSIYKSPIMKDMWTVPFDKHINVDDEDQQDAKRQSLSSTSSDTEKSYVQETIEQHL